MKTNTAIKNLNKVADEKKKVVTDYRGRKCIINNIRPTKAWKMIISALENGHNIIRPCFTSGRGRFCKNIDYTTEVKTLLDAAKIKYQAGNDSPRGGLTGNYIILTHIEK